MHSKINRLFLRRFGSQGATTEDGAKNAVVAYSLPFRDTIHLYLQILLTSMLNDDLNQPCAHSGHFRTLGDKAIECLKLSLIAIDGISAEISKLSIQISELAMRYVVLLEFNPITGVCRDSLFSAISDEGVNYTGLEKTEKPYGRLLMQDMACKKHKHNIESAVGVCEAESAKYEDIWISLFQLIKHDIERGIKGLSHSKSKIDKVSVGSDIYLYDTLKSTETTAALSSSILIWRIV